LWPLACSVKVGAWQVSQQRRRVPLPNATFAWNDQGIFQPALKIVPSFLVDDRPGRGRNAFG